MTAAGVFVAMVVAGFVGWALGFMACSDRVYRRMIRPWSDARPVGDPHFWLRARDFRAVWRGYCEATNLWGSMDPDRWSDASDTFDRAPQFPDECKR